jgi:uracil-DNA glycosylase
MDITHYFKKKDDITKDVFEDNSKDTIIIYPEIDPEWNILELAFKTVPNSWESTFKYAYPELELINKILQEKIDKGERIFPLKKNIFRAFYLTPLDNIKVVIIGQDPYHSTDEIGEPVANGLAFSVSNNSKLQPSLYNIFKEMKNCYPSFTYESGNLSDWAKQGVFLINSCLTVKPHEAGSHKKIWFGFIIKVLKAICNTVPNCIFLLWGDKAQFFRPYLEGRIKVLETSHPSGFSANRGFIGSSHFKTTNELLISLKKEPIDWNIY